ncbi:MAG: hypothetical protein ACI4EA_08425 [Candidatus Ornithomonoglobus sp.]
MLIINIIHSTDCVIEYLFISLFFKLFGIETYNSLIMKELNIHRSIKMDSMNELRDSVDESAEIVDIFIYDSEYMSVLQRSKSEYIMVSDMRGNCADNQCIDFPKKYNQKEITDFFERIIFGISGLIKNTNIKNMFQDFYMHRGEIIELFFISNILENWYIPLQLTKSSYDAIIASKKLEKLYKNHGNSNSEFIKYACINLGFMSNYLQIKAGIIPGSDYEILIDECHSLLMSDAKNDKSIYFLLGELYEDSKINSMLAYHSYVMSLYKGAYYRSYRCGVFCERQYSDRKLAAKYYEDSISYNYRYFQSIYKLGVLQDKEDKYTEALKKYNRVLLILGQYFNSSYVEPRLAMNAVEVIKNIIDLDRYFHSDILVNSARKLADTMCQMAEKSEFVNYLINFLYNDDTQKCSRICKETTEHVKKYIKSVLKNIESD